MVKGLRSCWLTALWATFPISRPVGAGCAGDFKSLPGRPALFLSFSRHETGGPGVYEVGAVFALGHGCRNKGI